MGRGVGYKSPLARWEPIEARLRWTLVALALCCSSLAALATSADAARTATKGERLALLRAAAASERGRSLHLSVRNGGRSVTIAPTTIPGPATVVAARSSVDPGWALLVVLYQGRVDQRETFLLQRRSGRWQVQVTASRGYESERLCQRSSPGVAVVVDLGLSADPGSGRCRHRRKPTRLVRPMTDAEQASIRALVEWRWVDTPESSGMEPGPVQPEVHDVFASNCSWDGRGEVVDPPSGVVARSNPRWGLLTIICVTGSDGFSLLENQTVMLVGRSGKSGPFTRVAAHTLPSWSSMGSLCGRDRRWPVPAAPRVALQFCTPFPAVLGDALG